MKNGEAKDLERILPSLLLDFYGDLLTDKMQNILQLSVEEDMSLSEIASELLISRQAVHDNIKRAMKQLETYESKIGAVQRYIASEQSIQKIKVMVLEQAEQQILINALEDLLILLRQ